MLAINAESAVLEVVKDEFQVNQSALNNQDHATVSMNQYGDSMIVWHDFSSLDGQGSAVVGRVFDNNGNALTNEFLINTTTAGFQRVPDIATNKNNLFVIVWESAIAANTHNAFAKIVSSSSEVLVDEFKVNDTASENKIYPDTAMYANGDFIVIWDQEEQGKLNFYMKFYNANGMLLYGPVKINEFPSDGKLDVGGTNGLPDIAINEKGDAIAVWERITGTNISVVGRLFNPYTQKAGHELLIDTPVSGFEQRRPMVDMNNAGDIVVTWVEYSEGSTDGDVYVKKYSASTSKWGNKISPHISLNDNQHLSVIKLTENGQFVVVWTAENPVYSDDVKMRFYNSRGRPLTTEILVNKTQQGAQKRPAIDWYEYLDHILMVITWESVEQDGDGSGAFSKIYRINY
jgi:hypothetical protein